jgi:hypothetical protein
MLQEIASNPEGVARLAVNKRRRNSFRVASSINEMPFPRVANAQPWAGIGERFQRYSFSDKQSLPGLQQPLG